MFNYLFLIAGICCFAYYIGMGLAVRFDQSILWIWLVFGAAFILRFAIVQISISRGTPLPYPDWFLTAFRIGVAAGLALFLFVEGFVLAGMFTSCPPGMDYLIVLGARVGSPGLEKRIAAAADYLLENPETLAVASGGQGSDEPISEAQYIAEGLAARGVSWERILMEDMSTSTSENMRFSGLLIPGGAKIALVSNDFHIFRARRLAQKVFGDEVYGLPARSSLFSLPHYMVREFATTVVDTLRGNMAYR